MSTTRRDVMVAAWLGFTLATLFFYPLAAALDGSSYYLQWQPRHLAETAVALAGLGAFFAIALVAVRPLSGRVAALALVALAALPLASFGVGVARQLPLRDTLIPLWEHRAIRLAVPVVMAACAAVALLAWPDRLRRALRGLLLVLSPVSLVVVKGLLFTGPPLVVEREARPVETGTGSPHGCAPVVAFLFDELSFSYVYDGTTVRSEFPGISRFASAATHHMAVAAPAPDTLVAMPAYLAARRPLAIRIEGGRLMELRADGRLIPFSAIEPDGLFATARRLGFRTEMAGYYHAYCALLGDLVDACRSFSFYNAAAIDGAFSPTHAILTTLTLWPRQFPFGLLKNPPFARQQRGLVEQTLAFARRPLDRTRPVFRFVHFSVPHLPFAFDRDGYRPPRDPLRTSPDDAYVRQLAYTDRLVGDLVTQLERSIDFDRSTIVLLSDHAFRFGGREQDPHHIPFIVKAPDQRTRRDVFDPERGETLLRSILEDSCEGR